MFFAPKPPQPENDLQSGDQTTLHSEQMVPSAPPPVPPAYEEPKEAVPTSTVQQGTEEPLQQVDDFTASSTSSQDSFLDEEPIQKVEVPEPEKKLERIDDVWFSDLYFTPEKIAYVHDTKTNFGLTVFEAEDLMDFHKALEEGFQGASSYSIHYGASLYRIERVKTVSGIHYTARRMPIKVPNVYDLGMPDIFINH